MYALTVGGWPTQVDQDSIRIQYTEDKRQEFLGYSVANISWNKPESTCCLVRAVSMSVYHHGPFVFSDHQYLTSYTIRILTEAENCGGLNRVYTYRGISKASTYHKHYQSALL